MEEKAWVQHRRFLNLMAPPSTSWVFSGQLLRLNASSVKWRNKYVAHRADGRTQGASSGRVLNQLEKANSSVCFLLLS